MRFYLILVLLMPYVVRGQSNDKFVTSLNPAEQKDLQALQKDWNEQEKKPGFGDFKNKALVVCQMVLGRLGYGVTFSGVLDDRTAEAIKAYQNNRQISQSGVLDPETVFSLTRDEDFANKEIMSMASFDLGWADDSISANGVWDKMNNTDSYLQSTEIECDRGKTECTEADAVVGFNSVIAKQTVFAVTKWDKYEVIAEDDTPDCERDELRINHQEKTVTTISTPTYKNASCTKLLGKPETVTYRLVSGAQIAADRVTALQQHKKPLYLISPQARAILDKK